IIEVKEMITYPLCTQPIEPHGRHKLRVSPNYRRPFCYNPSTMPGPAFKSPRYIALEGPIRVGKSTLAKVLAEQLHARRITDCDDNPFLADFYEEKPGAA